MQRNAPWLATVALAAGLAAFQVDAGPNDPLPDPGRAGTVTMISGGVGSEQAELFKDASPRYPLRVVFSAKGGAYAVPEQFNLLYKGQVIGRMSDAGPWLLIDLPPGSYTLQAMVAGRMHEKQVSVGRGGTTVQWVVQEQS